MSHKNTKNAKPNGLTEITEIEQQKYSNLFSISQSFFPFSNENYIINVKFTESTRRIFRFSFFDVIP